MKVSLVTKQLKVVWIGNKKNKKRIKLCTEQKRQHSSEQFSKWWKIALSRFILLSLHFIDKTLRVLAFCSLIFGQNQISQIQLLHFFKVVFNIAQFIVYETLRIDLLTTAEHLVSVCIQMTMKSILFGVYPRLSPIYNFLSQYIFLYVKRFMYLCCLPLKCWICNICERILAVPMLEETIHSISALPSLLNINVTKLKRLLCCFGLYVDRFKYHIYYLQIYNEELEINTKFTYSTISTLKDLHHFITHLLILKGKRP